jgi:hypothetical protein
MKYILTFPTQSDILQDIIRHAGDCYGIPRPGFTAVLRFINTELRAEYTCIRDQHILIFDNESDMMLYMLKYDCSVCKHSEIQDDDMEILYE